MQCNAIQWTCDDHCSVDTLIVHLCAMMLICVGFLVGLTRHVPVLLQPKQAEWTYHQPGTLCRTDCYSLCDARRISDCPLSKVLLSTLMPNHFSYHNISIIMRTRL